MRPGKNAGIREARVRTEKCTEMRDDAYRVETCMAIEG